MASNPGLSTHNESNLLAIAGNAVAQTRISINGIVEIDGAVLLLENDRDKWELPIGRIEGSESPTETLGIREGAV